MENYNIEPRESKIILPTQKSEHLFTGDNIVDVYSTQSWKNRINCEISSVTNMDNVSK